jgi:predicted transcriptional regulator
MTAGDDRRGAADAAGVSGGNSLDQLEAQLEEAERIFQKDHLRGAAAALDAVFDDLLARGIRHRGPVLALRAGLQDLADGAPPEWLKVGKGRGRVRLGREERAWRARVAATTEWLTAHGMRVEDATRKVAETLGLSKSAVKHYIERVSECNSQDFDAELIVKEYKRILTEYIGETEAAVERACDLLREASRKRGQSHSPP